MKYSMEPTAAKAEPIMKVVEMTALILMPMSCEVSKSRDTARMAMPTLVCWISITRPTTSSTVKIGVTMVTTFVLAEPI